MSDLREQRYAIEFLIWLKKSLAETYEELEKRFSSNIMGYSVCFHWHKSYLEGRDSCELQGGSNGDHIL